MNSLKPRNVEEAGTVVFQAASLAWDIMEVNPEKEIKSKNKVEDVDTFESLLWYLYIHILDRDTIKVHI